jgi:hypothetical protein
MAEKIILFSKKQSVFSSSAPTKAEGMAKYIISVGYGFVDIAG